ncbi:MAG: PAS domain S-box protein [Dehalococcoidia bacterium]|nr:MAG: PAS domain S-box protein [Dehalococcoidia bacterium]
MNENAGGYNVFEEALRVAEGKYQLLSDYNIQLAKISILFLEAADEKGLYSSIADSFRGITNSIAATFSVYKQDSQDLQVISLSIDPINERKVASILGPGLFEMRMPVGADDLEQMRSQIIRRPKDLYELSSHEIPREVSRAIMKDLGCNQIIALPISYAGEIFGTCVAYMAQEMPVVIDEALIVYAQIAGAAIKRQRLDDDLLAREEKYHIIADFTFDWEYWISPSGTFIYVSPSCKQHTGYVPEEFMKDAALLQKIVHPDDREGLALHIEDSLDINKVSNPIDFRIITRDGEERWVGHRCQNVYGRNGTFLGRRGNNRDITKRKHTEQMLARSEEKYRKLVESAIEAIFVAVEGKIVFLNQRTCTISGYSSEELMTRPFVEFVHPDDRDMVIDRHIKRLRGEEAIPRYEFRIMRKDSEMTWAELNTVAITWEGKMATLNFLEDITERKKVEAELWKKQVMLARTEGIAHVGSWEWDVATDTVTWSDELFRIFQRDPQEGAPSFAEHPAFYHPDDFALLQQAAEAAVADGTPYELELRAIRKDGETRVCVARGVAEMGLNGRAIRLFGSLQDITERKAIEVELLKSYERLKNTLDDAIDTMAKIVEMRDLYTAGHQQRVSDLSSAIAGEMKLEDTRIEQLRMAAAIHDIGKIYVPSEILSKPGKLSTMEFSLIKTHAQAGYDIIKSMDFPYPVAQAILQHHERTDGSGYPNQLRGEDILLEAKILAVADVVEAMASYRPYRPALGINKALEEISQNRGKLYDPAVVDACVQLFNSGKFEFKSI